MCLDDAPTPMVPWLVPSHAIRADGCRPEARPVHKMSRVKSMCQSSPTARVAALQELLIKQTHEAGSMMRGSTFWGPDR